MGIEGTDADTDAPPPPQMLLPDSDDAATFDSNIPKEDPTIELGTPPSVSGAFSKSVLLIFVGEPTKGSDALSSVVELDKPGTAGGFVGAGDPMLMLLLTGGFSARLLL